MGSRGVVRDFVVGLVATFLMYFVPYTLLRDTSSWALYLFWVFVASSYTCYALYRFSRSVGGAGGGA